MSRPAPAVPYMTGQAIVKLMRAHGKTIRTLSAEMGITMKRVRHVRAHGTEDRYIARDWVQAITGTDPGDIYL
jgi:hypothetical protein